MVLLQESSTGALDVVSDFNTSCEIAGATFSYDSQTPQPPIAGCHGLNAFGFVCHWPQPVCLWYFDLVLACFHLHPEFELDSPQTGQASAEPGDVHEFTFLCYKRQPLLTNDDGIS